MAKIDIYPDSQNDLTVYTVHGELTAEEIIKTIPQYSTRLILWDAREGTLGQISTDELRKISKTAQALNNKRIEGKTAFVGKKDIDYGIGRMYEAFADLEGLPFEYSTFKSMEDAKHWLGIK